MPPPTPLSQAGTTIQETSSSDAAAAPQTVSTPVKPRDSDPMEATSEDLRRLTEAQTLSSLAAAEEVQRFLDTAKKPTVREFNAALQSLVSTRRPGEPLNLMLSTYNAMLSRSLLPTAQTYITMITALLDRDHEVSRLVASHASRSKLHTLSQAESVKLARDHAKLDALTSENNFQSAYSLFQAILATGEGHRIPISVYEQLLRGCAHRSDADTLGRIYAEFESRQGLSPTPLMFRYMIQTLANTNRADAVDSIFAQFQLSATSQKQDTPVTPQARYAIMQVYNQTIEAFFRLGRPEKAIDLFGTMMSSDAVTDFNLGDTPTPSSSTYTCIIAGWIEAGDIRSAEKWFSMLLQQTCVSLPKSFFANGDLTRNTGTLFNILCAHQSRSSVRTISLGLSFLMPLPRKLTRTTPAPQRRCKILLGVALYMSCPGPPRNSSCTLMVSSLATCPKSPLQTLGHGIWTCTAPSS